MRAANVLVIASVGILVLAPTSVPARPPGLATVLAANDGVALSSGSAATDVLSSFSLRTVDGEAKDIQNEPPQPNDLRVPGVDGEVYWISLEPIVTSDMVVRA